MIGLVGIRGVGRWIFLFILAGVIAGCGSDGEVAAPSSDPSTTAAVDAVLDVDEFGIMDSSAITDSFYPEITEDDIEVVEGDAGTSYRYVFPTRELSDGVSVDLEARWDPADGGYQASLKWGLIGDETSPSDYVFVASIPKSFAETVDDIVFDPEPTRIIDPDPILEWEIDLSGLAQRWIAAFSEAGFDPGETSGLAMLTISEILSKANAIRVNAELDACGGRLVQSAEMLGQCYLNVVAANPGAFGARDCEVMELLSGGRGDDYPGLSGACQTILDLNKGINDPVCAHEVDGDEIEACREAMWTLLSGGCLTGNALERQVCVYEAAVATSREGRCEILDHLGNPEMANDCRAAVTMNHLYCAKTEDPELRASCCENFRGTDDYDTCLGAIREDAAGESTSSTTEEGTTSSDPADSTTTEPAEEEPPPAIPAGTYTGSFDNAQLIAANGLDPVLRKTNEITVTIDDEGVISGGFTVHQEGSFLGCPGWVDDYIGVIDAGQRIQSSLPQTVIALVYYTGRESMGEEGLTCLESPRAFSEQAPLQLEVIRYSDGLLVGALNDFVYVPFKLRLAP